MPTERQQRERDFFNAWASEHKDLSLSFRIVSGERRSSNSYWYTYELLKRNKFTHDTLVLDLGCGSGTHSARISFLGARVVGIDISSGALEVASQRVSRLFPGNAAFIQVPCENLCFRDNTFDYVFGVDILHHVCISEAMGEVMRVLKPGGSAYFREHFTHPWIEQLRNTPLVLKLFPKRADHQITPDERKLVAADVQLIQSAFRHTEIFYFDFLGKRLYLPDWIQRVIQVIDNYIILRVFPFLKRFSASVVIRGVK